MAGATIKIFLADGTPLGLRVLEKSNWTGRGFDFARLTSWRRIHCDPLSVRHAIRHHPSASPHLRYSPGY